MMLGTFPKFFSQVATFKGYFPEGQLPKCAICQAATSQVCPSCSTWPPVCSSRSARPPKPILAAELAPPLQSAAPQRA